jgi:hypothetical protein
MASSGPVPGYLAPMGATTMRPRRVGEILDASIKIYLRNARTLMGLAACVVIPLQVLSAVVLLSTVPSGSDVPGGTFSVSSNSNPGVNAGARLGAQATLVVIELIASTLVTAACTKAVSDAYLDHSPRAGESLRFALRRLPALVAVEFLTLLGLIVAFILLVIPGIWLYAAWAVAVPALLIERIGPFGALRRSRRLVKGRWWATAAVLLVATIMLSLITGAIEALLIGIESLPSQPSLFVAVLGTTVSGAVAGIITQPFRAATTTVLYYDLRVRREGYDLYLLADQLGLPPVDGAPPVDEAAAHVPEPAWGGGHPSGEYPVGPESVGQPGGPPFWPPPPGWTPDP